MSGVNKAILIGRLGKDPDMRYMTNGDAVTNCSIATPETWKDKSGEKQEKTEWHNLVFYRRLAEIAGEYLKKGSQIYVEGKIQTRKWQDKEGNDRYTTEVVVQELRMLDTRQPTIQSEPGPSQPVAGRAVSPTHFDDDIPF